MSKEELSDKEKASIRAIIEKAGKAGDVNLMQKTVYDISEEYKFNPIQLIEHMLRDMDSTLYLVAHPFTESMVDYTAKLPDRNDIIYPYYLWVCASREEADRLMEQLYIMPDENDNNLRLTGLLYAKPDTRTARMKMASRN